LELKIIKIKKRNGKIIMEVKGKEAIIQLIVEGVIIL
jgi:hypothetical protein